MPKLIALLKALDDVELDQGTQHFQRSNLEIVNIDIGNTADNVIPRRRRPVFNVRFNDQYSGDSLEKKLRAALDAVKIPYELRIKTSGESFYTPPGAFSDMISAAVEKETAASRSCPPPAARRTRGSSRTTAPSSNSASSASPPTRWMKK